MTQTPRNSHWQEVEAAYNATMHEISSLQNARWSKRTTDHDAKIIADHIAWLQKLANYLYSISHTEA